MNKKDKYLLRECVFSRHDKDYFVTQCDARFLSCFTEKTFLQCFIDFQNFVKKYFIGTGSSLLDYEEANVWMCS